MSTISNATSSHRPAVMYIRQMRRDMKDALQYTHTECECQVNPRRQEWSSKGGHVRLISLRIMMRRV